METAFPVHFYLLAVGALAVVGLLLNAIALVNLAGLKARMVTADQQRLAVQELDASVKAQIAGASERTANAIELLRQDYTQVNESLVRTGASYEAILRQTDHMSREYSKFQILLLDRVLELGGVRRPTPAETAEILGKPLPSADSPAASSSRV